MAFTLATALLLSGGAGASASRILAIHERICAAILKLARIPAAGTREVEVFPAFGTAAVPVTSVRSYHGNRKGAALIFAVSFAFLWALHRRLSLARNFLVFLMTTLAVSAAALFLAAPEYQDAVRFSLMWLRIQVLLWFLLPWLGAFLIIPIQPSLPAGVAWIAAMEGYAVVWSAGRLAFCLAVLHHTGMIYLALLWFCLGPLADLLAILVFYSLAVSHSCARTWGTRACQS